MQVCTAKMNLGDEVDLEDYVSRPDKISAAEVSCFYSHSVVGVQRESIKIEPLNMEFLFSCTIALFTIG